MRELAGRIGDGDWSGCIFEERDEQRGLALYDCREGVGDEGRRIGAEDETVATMPGAMTVLSIPVKPWDNNSSTLVVADGKVYLALLRRKLEIEVYSTR